MAQAFDAATDGGVVLSASSMTYSHTCSGSDRGLYVVAFSVGDIVTGVTYNSVSMTLVDKHVGGSGGNYSYLFYLAAPATGSHSVVVTLSGSSVVILSCASSYTGVSQTGEPNAHNSAGAASTSVSASVTPAESSSWIVAAGVCDSGGFSGVTGYTTRAQHAANGIFIADSAAPVAAGSNTVTANGTNGNMALVVAAFGASFDIATMSWKSDIPDILLDTAVDSVASGFTPRSPADANDPTPN